ncbi:MAG: hypothetical protein ACLTG4_07545 [Oscillospiraceae bacterium]
MRGKTDEFAALRDGESLDDLLPGHLPRRASLTCAGMKPFRVQLIGGIVLHRGRIAERRPAKARPSSPSCRRTNALTAGSYIVTISDYLARRDSEWMGKVYRFLGERRPDRARHVERRAPAAYAADITYGTNNEMGFDYLHDNMAIYKSRWCSAARLAIVDQVDSSSR